MQMGPVTHSKNDAAGGVVDDDEEYLIDRETEQEHVENAVKRIGEIYNLKPSPKTSKLIYRDQGSRVVRGGEEGDFGDKGSSSVWKFVAIAGAKIFNTGSS